MLRALALLLFLPFAALAQGLPAPVSDRINDFADLLPPDAQARVAQLLQSGRDETGVHVVVVTMDKMADNGGVGEPISEYAKRLFNQWAIGDASRNDGILILVAVTDREMRIALGSGYPVIWDNAAQRVIDRYMLPEFSQDRYADGIEAGVAATYDLIARPFAAGQAAPEDEGEPTDWFGLGLLALFGAGMVALVMRSPLGNLVIRLRACPNCGQRRLRRTRETLEEPTDDASGRGVFHIRCSACGHERTKPFIIPSRQSSGSSSGFGGGSSSGGGASGKW